MPFHASPVQFIVFGIYWTFHQLFRLFRSGPIPRTEENVEGKVAIITGANAGLGKHTAQELAKRGATVIMACRNMVEGEKALKEVQLNSGSNKLELIELNLADLSSVRKFASIVRVKYDTIDILVNNAGIALTTDKLSYTKDGFEIHIGTNHLGHFLLTNLLLDNLKRASSARIVTVSSSNVIMSNLDINDLMMDKATWLGLGNTMAYNNSKLANALFNKELGKRLQQSCVRTYAVCPGVVKTNVFQHFSTLTYVGKLTQLFLIDPIGLPIPKGADVILYCCLAKEVSQSTGKWYRCCKEIQSIESLLTDDLTSSLWNKSEKLVGMNNNY